MHHLEIYYEYVTLPSYTLDNSLPLFCYFVQLWSLGDYFIPQKSMLDYVSVYIHRSGSGIYLGCHCKNQNLWNALKPCKIGNFIFYLGEIVVMPEIYIYH